MSHSRRSTHSWERRDRTRPPGTRFEVRLLTEDPELLRLADAAFEPVSAIRRATERTELREHEDRSQEILTAFIEAAGRQLR